MNTVISVQTFAHNDQVLIVNRYPQAWMLFVDGKPFQVGSQTATFHNHARRAEDPACSIPDEHKSNFYFRNDQVLLDAGHIGCQRVLKFLQVSRENWAEAGFPGINNADGIEVEHLE
jgi:hypothetical protein